MTFNAHSFCIFMSSIIQNLMGNDYSRLKDAVKGALIALIFISFFLIAKELFYQRIKTKFNLEEIANKFLLPIVTFMSLNLLLSIFILLCRDLQY